MLNKKIVQKALDQIWSMDKYLGSLPDKTSDSLSSVTSRLVYDSFGGEILKTHLKKGWHFYNRIDGERIDFTIPEKRKSSLDIPFEDIPSNPDEAHNYFQEDDYSTQFIKFIRAFEEIMGLKRYRRRMAA
jgi:hypothetical protein